MKKIECICPPVDPTKPVDTFNVLCPIHGPVARPGISISTLARTRTEEARNAAVVDAVLAAAQAVAVAQKYVDDRHSLLATSRGHNEPWSTLLFLNQEIEKAELSLVARVRELCAAVAEMRKVKP